MGRDGGGRWGRHSGTVNIKRGWWRRGGSQTVLRVCQQWSAACIVQGNKEEGLRGSHAADTGLRDKDANVNSTCYTDHHKHE